MIGARLRQPANIVDGAVVVSRDPLRPQIGDLRISYSAAKADQASIVAAQKGAERVPFVASNGRAIFLSRRRASSPRRPCSRTPCRATRL